MLEKLYGDPIKIGPHTIYTFPKTSVLSELSESDLRKARIGYHAKYVKATAQILVKQTNDFKLHGLSEDNARAKLLSLPGVGNKVADCVLTFACKFPNITPVDVWAKKFLTGLYGLPTDWTYEKYRSWIKENFYGYASWADQFLFEWYRLKGKS